MPTGSGLERIPDRVEEELFLKLLGSLEQAQTTETNRTCIGKFRQKIQQKRAAKRGNTNATAEDPSQKPSWSSSESEQDLSTADRFEPSYRCVPRILCAGTWVNVVQDAAKEACLKDIEELLGPYWNLVPAPFPLKGGRIYIARVLSYILLRHVSLMDIKKWFYIPNSGKMSIAEELLMELRERGVTWPPNVAGFRQCTIYKVGKSPKLGEEASSSSSSSSSSSDSHSLQRTAMPFAEGPANMLTNEVHMQHWPVPADFMLPSWEPDSASNLPSISSVDPYLEMYGSGVSSGELADFHR